MKKGQEKMKSSITLSLIIITIISISFGWIKTDLENTILYSVVENNSGFLIAVGTYYDKTDTRNGLVLFTDSEGNEIWREILGYKSIY
ncbi:hypothetical protein DRQ33_08615, partial [bacterium]